MLQAEALRAMLRAHDGVAQLAQGRSPRNLTFAPIIAGPRSVRRGTVPRKILLRLRYPALRWSICADAYKLSVLGHEEIA